MSREPGLVYFRIYSNLNQTLTLCNTYLQQRDCYLKFCFFKLYVALMACWHRDKYDLIQRNLLEKMSLQSDPGDILVRHKGDIFLQP